MKIKVDEKADALYFRLNDARVVESEELAPGVILDYDDQDEVVGIEILGLSKRTSKVDLKEVLLQTA